jgi:hypothetical protein
MRVSSLERTTLLADPVLATRGRDRAFLVRGLPRFLCGHANPLLQKGGRQAANRGQSWRCRHCLPFAVVAHRFAAIDRDIALLRQSRNQRVENWRSSGKVHLVIHTECLVPRDAMTSFLRKFSHLVLGVLSGFDRLFFRGTLRNLAYSEGLQHYLWANRIPYKDFAAHSEAVTHRLEEASLAQARAQQREIRYINTHQVRLEDEARQLAARDKISEGLIGVFRRIEPCMSFQIIKNRAAKKLEIVYRPRQCVYLYHYQIHPVFGFMHARIQTWFPFHVYVCLNGHDWLARHMDQAKLAYRRQDNCFPWVADVDQAQALYNKQLQAHWPSLLDGLAQALNPIHNEIFVSYPTAYYWSVAQSEWSTDVLFRNRSDLTAYYPRWIRHAITTYGAADILRFLGRRTPAGQVPPLFNGEVQSNVHERVEGVRVKHWLNHNSLKMYDKGSVLRAECTIHDPREFYVYRPKEGEADGPKAWRPMRYGVADCHRRAEVSQAANERYLEALAAVEETTPLQQLMAPLCRPVWEPRRATPATPRALPVEDAPPVDDAPRQDNMARGSAGADVQAEPAPAAGADRAVRPRRRLRALNPLAANDQALLEAVTRPAFLLNGLRNRDLRGLLYKAPAGSPEEKRRRSAAIGRQLRLLRGHGVLHKVAKTHRYTVSEQGLKAITALLAARNANAEFLVNHAA